MTDSLKQYMFTQATRATNPQQTARTFLRQLANTAGAIEKRWKELGVPNSPSVAYLKQFPAFVVRHLLAHAELIHAKPGDVIVSGNMEDRAGGLFLVLHGRVELHSHWVSTARDASIVCFAPLTVPLCSLSIVSFRGYQSAIYERVSGEGAGLEGVKGDIWPSS
jgi:hypothetical protein